MIDDTGIFRTTISVAALASPDRRRDLADAMVDTGSEYNWVPRDVLLDLGVAPVRIDRFETADGRVLEREVGFALLYAGGRSATTIVVFAEDGDMVLLGAHGLDGLNMRIDLGRKELVPAGPVPAALTLSRSVRRDRELAEVTCNHRRRCTRCHLPSDHDPRVTGCERIESACATKACGRFRSGCPTFARLHFVRRLTASPALWRPAASRSGTRRSSRPSRCRWAMKRGEVWTVAAGGGYAIIASRASASI